MSSTQHGSAEPRISPRMRLILDAGVTVIAREGLRGLTHRAVDRQAGLPEGSCSAYLRTRLALLTALGQYVAASFADDVRGLADRLLAHADRLAEGDRDLEYAVEQTLECFVSWLEHPELLQTRFELELEGRRQPELARLSASWAQQLLAIVEDMMRHKGHPHPEERAATLVASMEGVLIRALRERPEQRRPFLDRSLRLLITLLVADD